MVPPNINLSLKSHTPKSKGTTLTKQEEELELDLSLSSNDSSQGSKTKLDFMHYFKNNNQESCFEGKVDSRVFSCNYCQRKFYCSQALGGHQNAHKRERTLAKGGTRIGVVAFGNSNWRFSSMPSLRPLRGLGIQEHSMIHKPYLSSHVYGHNNNNKNCFRNPIDRKPAIGRVLPENRSPEKINIHGGYWWDCITYFKNKDDELKKVDLTLKL